jgi:hypothetical protein
MAIRNSRYIVPHLPFFIVLKNESQLIKNVITEASDVKFNIAVLYILKYIGV